ncbi:DEAD/DEAH box helicase [Yoonia sp.]|uniref:DEAD/DEAH box helicase n=1 Tax=Yoonia sp. TaxID=2212373 RepID=UPI001A020534|nr:DEAD/DEAH box helicase [Yoonia sp.]MBE0412878.1 DEAD/DEAH box helicase [Yoonia sp.]
MIPTLAAALAKQGYTEMTPVQTAVTDPALEGKDLLVSAQTGSGKTVGFGLAIGPTILTEDGTFGPAGRPLALVIAPTRELALQVKRELQWLYASAGVTMASCVGGMDMRDERRALDRGAHMVVATPGRLKDHIMRGSLDMSDIRAIVLDEADEMLDLGFREDLEYILSEAPDNRRTLMFSATVPPMIAKLAKSYQRDAVRVATTAKESQHADIEYRALSVANHDIDAAIINVLRYYDAPNAIVFCNTRASVTRLTTRLANRGFATVALSGELSQTERSHALQAMRDGRARVCVATDVAARGIDLPNLELVIHAELPTNAETLLHRSGRTGRAGRKGISAMIVPAKMKRRAQNLLTWGKLQATWALPPTAEEVTARDEERLLTDPVWSMDFTENEQAFAARLLATHAPEKIAAAYLRLYAGKQSAPEDLSDYKDGPAAPTKERAPREHQSFGPSRWFSVDVGRDGKAEARWLLPMICKAGGITKNEIGAIRIQPNETFIEISEPAVADFLKSIGSDMKLENQATLSALDGPPQLGERGPRKTKRDYDDSAPAKPKRHAPRDQSPPPPSAQDDLAPIKPIPGAADDRPAPRKPRQNPAQKKERRDHGDALVEKRPGKPPYKGKPAAGKPGRPGKPAYKSDSKPRDAASSGKPQASAKDTSKRFVPPGGKAKPRKAPSKGGQTTPRRGKT